MSLLPRFEAPILVAPASIIPLAASSGLMPPAALTSTFRTRVVPHKTDIVFDCGTGRTEARGCLDEVGTLNGDYVAEHLLLGLGEKAGLDDDLKDRSLGMNRFCDYADLSCASSNLLDFI